MIKTAEMIVDDIYQMLLTSPLVPAPTQTPTRDGGASSSQAVTINGGVYKEGCRPVDSQLEDIVVIFTSSTANQIQDGIVTINIYVPDIDPYADGTLVKNGARIAALEGIAAEWVTSLNKSSGSEYRFSLYRAIHNTEDPSIKQHFIVIQLRFRRLTD